MADTVFLTVILLLSVIAAALAIWLKISTVIVEIAIGVAAASLFGVSPAGHDWLPFLAAMGSLVLTFLAGLEIDPEAFRRDWKAANAIGIAAFVSPFLGCWAFAQFVLGWPQAPAMIAGVALSTTSVAVVFVVLMESGLTTTRTGKLILSACFINDLATVAALSLLFRPPDLVFLALMAGALLAAGLGLPRAIPMLFKVFGSRPNEFEVKFLLVIAFGFGVLAEYAGSQAVLPAYVLGLLLAGTMAKNRAVFLRMRTLALAFLTPAFFINAGLNIDAAAVAAGAVLVVAFTGAKMGSKLLVVLPLARRFIPRHSTYTALLMSTGLTFGTISATYGLQAGIIDRGQFSVLVTAVLMTAIVPTLIAQRWFDPIRREPGILAPTEGGGAAPAKGEK
jgi:glutathione-regulated potassium-efflux system ancillary protein KefC